MRVVLISTYEMGRQPFGLASPAAWLERAGAEVICFDLSREALDADAVRAAGLIGFYVPMHTATRLAVRLLPRVRCLNSAAHLCFYGLYAPVNAEFLRSLGAGTIVGGEFEAALVRLYERLSGGPVNGTQASAAASQSEPLISLERLTFLVPDRSRLAPLSEYARLIAPDGTRRTVGYTEASRGCKHLCRHCPVVPVYQGRFRIVNREVVLEDIRRQVAAGARHITFGDPDFFNGVGHAIAIVRRLHEEFPFLTYDVTIKIEHLLEHRERLATLRETGCVFVTSAVESVDDRILALLDKGHTRAGFLEALRLCRAAGLTLAPTFVAFTPWATLGGYRELLALLAAEDLVANVAPIQLAIRLLIPAGSRLLELPEARAVMGEFDCEALSYRWEHPDPRMDQLCRDLQALVRRAEGKRASRREIFEEIWHRAYEDTETAADRGSTADPDRLDRAAIPYINEPWYC